VIITSIRNQLLYAVRTPLLYMAQRILVQGLGRFSCAWNVHYVTHHNFEVDYPP